MSKQQMTMLVMELKGFSALASELSRRMEYLGITPERVRQSGRHLIDEAIRAAEKESKSLPIERKDIGGDTWYFTFDGCLAALRFGAALMSRVFDVATTHGVYYLKPSLALNVGSPRVSGDRFLDDASIAAYKVADSGEPFLFQVLPAANKPVRSALATLGWTERLNTNTPGLYDWIDWRSTRENEESSTGTSLIHLTSLLMDNDVVFFRSTEQVIEQMITLQARAKRMFIYGGAPPTMGGAGKSYAKYIRTLQGVFERAEVRCVVHNYYYPQSADGAVWLALFREFVEMFPTTLAYSAITLAERTPKPLSFHVYDDTTMLMLRRYDPIRGRPALSSSMMLRNEEVARRFEEDCTEGIRAIGGPFDRAAFDRFEESLRLSESERNHARRYVRKVIRHHVG